jgi:gliding motility-associated-like protein
MKKYILLPILSMLCALFIQAQPSEIGTSITNLRKSHVTTGDINNDGNMDIVISGIDGLGDYQCKIYSNNGSNIFTDLGANLIKLIDGDIALADFNGDNYLDIAICGRDQLNNKYSIIYRNNQNNTFTDIGATLLGLNFGSISWADYDNDGDQDLLICGRSASNTRTLIYENTGSGTFVEVNPGIPGVYWGKATWGDVNNDGYVDIAVSGLNISNNYITEIYLNDGDKSFSAYNAPFVKLAFTSQHFIDYDNDGDLDFWISGSNELGNDVIKLYKNTLGNFTEVATGFNTLWGVSSSWGDYDADGDADLIYLGLNTSTPTTYYYQNNGSDVFTMINLGITGITEGDMCWSDFNNDMKQDIFITGSSNSGNESKLYRNNFVQSNTNPTAPNSLTTNTIVNGFELSWAAGADGQTQANGLSYRLCLGTSPGNYDILSPMGNLSSGKTYLNSQGLIKAPHTIINLPQGSYYWRVQTIDASGAGSEFSSEASFAICDPISIGLNKTMCDKSELRLSAGLPSDIVNWYSLNHGLIASNTNELSWNIAGSDQIRVEVIKIIGCAQRDTIEINALPVPTITLPVSDQACFGDILKYTAGQNFEIVKWFDQNNTLLQTGNQFEYPTISDQIIKCEITGKNKCIDSAKIAIHVFSLPNATLGEDFGVCKGQPAQLQINNMEQVNWYSLPWKSIATDQPLIDVAVVSDTTIIAEFYNSDNCKNYDTIMLYSNMIDWINAGTDTVICNNTSLVLGGNPTAHGGSAPYTYNWVDADNQTFSDQANPIVNPRENSRYRVYTTDNNGCQGNDEISVIVNPKPLIDPGSDRDICFGSQVELGSNPTAQNSLFPYSYQWWPENDLDNAAAANPMASPGVTTTYRLIVSTGKCKPDTAFINVNVNPLPQIVISPDISIGFGQTTIIEATGGTEYQWSPTEGIQNPFSSQIEVSPISTTTYTVTVTDENNCSNQDAVTINLKNDFFIPNLFTPNGDGNNETLKIYGTGIEQINMVIYNKSGNIVFQNNDIGFMLETGWDGTCNGAAQPQGSYFYVINGRYIDGSLIDKDNKGSINLLR